MIKAGQTALTVMFSFFKNGGPMQRANAMQAAFAVLYCGFIGEALQDLIKIAPRLGMQYLLKPSYGTGNNDFSSPLRILPCIMLVYPTALNHRCQIHIYSR